MLECKSSLAEAIIAIVDKRGIEIVNSPGIFCAIIDDIIPDLDKERKIIRRVFDEEVAKYIVDAYFSEKNQRNIILKRLNLYLENSLGVSEEWRSIFLDAFSIAFAWDYVTKTKERNRFFKIYSQYYCGRIFSYGWPYERWDSISCG